MRNSFIQNRRRMVIPLVMALLIIISGQTASAEITVSASLSRADFSLDESAQLTITVTGARTAELHIPESEGFTIYQRGRSSQINMVNGEFSSSVTFSCLVQAYKKGSYTIPEIEISTDGKTLTTEAIPFAVTDSRQAPAKQSPNSSRVKGTAAAEDKTTFIQLVLDRHRTYVGEITPVEVKAYFRQGLRANLKTTPTLVGDGVVMAQLHDQPAQTQEYINGTVFNVLSWQTTLTSIKEGNYPIRFELDAVQLIPQRHNSTSLFGSRSPFDDDFFDSFFGGGYKQLPLKVVSDDIQFDILPLPEENKPASFTGAIGDFTLIASVEPSEVETGEPLTLKMTIGGEGNFDRVESPAFPDLPGWKTYAPTSEFFGKGNDSHLGKKVFEQAIVAQNSSIRQVPSLTFSFFDPEKGAYVTKTTEPIPVTIKASARQSTVTAPPVTKPEPEEEKKTQSTPYPGLAPIKLEPDTPVPHITPLFLRGPFIALLAGCLLTLLSIIIYGIWRTKSRGNAEITEKKKVRKQLHEVFSQLKKTADSGNSQQFLALCRSTIQGYLGTLWGCVPATITRADLKRKLPEERELQEILATAELAAYGRSQLDNSTMHNYLKQLRDSLERLS